MCREAPAPSPNPVSDVEEDSFVFARDPHNQKWSTPLFKTRLARDIARNTEINQGFIESFNSRQAGADAEVG